MGFPCFYVRKPRFRQQCMLHSQFKTKSLVPLSTPSRHAQFVYAGWITASLPLARPWHVLLGLPLHLEDQYPRSVLAIPVAPRTFLSLLCNQLGNSAPGLRTPFVLPCPSKTFLSPRCLDSLVRVPASWSPLITLLHSICAGHRRLDSWVFP